MNTGRDEMEYPVKELVFEDVICTKNPEKGKYSAMMVDIVDNSKQLFVSPILSFTLISITINFTFHIG